MGSFFVNSAVVVVKNIKLKQWPVVCVIDSRILVPRTNNYNLGNPRLVYDFKRTQLMD